MDALFLGVPSQDGTWLFFFRPFVLRFGCVLEETQGTTYSLEVVRKVLEEGQKTLISRLFNVIELYVIKS